MNTVILQRMKTSDEGTEGVVTCPAIPGFGVLYSLEDPWRNNLPDVSCILQGDYLTQWVTTPKHPDGVYLLQNVVGRTACEIHKGNFGGDKALLNPFTGENYKSDVMGCILLGLERGILDGQSAVLESTLALQKFNGLLGKEDFIISVRNVSA